MDIGFIGLGNMGAPMAKRLIEAGHKLVVYDTRNDAVAPFVALGAQLASSPQDVADRVETVMASLPSLQISQKGRARRGRRHRRQAHQALRRSFHHRLARRRRDLRGAGQEEHRADR